MQGFLTKKDNIMFKCAITGKMSRPGEKPIKIVLKTRPKVYTEVQRNEETGLLETVQIGSGWEIVSECYASAEGARIWNEAQEKKEAMF